MNDINLGSQIHAYSLRIGNDHLTPVANALFTMYAKCGNIESANRLFNSLSHRDIISWTTMITSFSQNGNIEKAREYFDEMPERNVISWNSMLAGYVQHGFWEEGLNVLMRLQGVKPDWITFVSSIGACANAAILKLGHQIVSQVEKFGFGSDVSEYMKGKELIDKMPMEPNAAVWGALLGACRIHGNSIMAETALKNLVELDAEDSGSYVLLANLYSDSGNLENVSNVRKLMKDKGIRKNPGCSWMEVDNRVHVFTVDDTNHPRIKDVYDNVQDIIRKIEETGMYAVKNGAMYHSEKLALAFGLMSLPAWMPVNIMKNLRICDDCHMFMKMASRVTSRELIVRDANQ
ncbi:pentatricopeptide repeat-containing protein [Tanacetum coccineum]